ncbi:hypothetical protein BASA84_001328 [Batrachochytrium salamandrivorans]|nr:hypothetical protein BASA84_001328 [Batrachochytrium salamandrivorans]
MNPTECVADAPAACRPYYVDVDEQLSELDRLLSPPNKAASPTTTLATICIDHKGDHKGDCIPSPPPPATTLPVHPRCRILRWSHPASVVTWGLASVALVAVCASHLGLLPPVSLWPRTQARTTGAETLDTMAAPAINPSTPQVLSYLGELEAVAAQHGDSRSVATGHPASVEFVLSQLSEWNSTFKVWTEDVHIKAQVDHRPPILNIFSLTTSSRSGKHISKKHGSETVFKPRMDVAVVPGSGSGTVSGGILRVDNWVAVIGPHRSPGCSPCDNLAAAIRLGAKAAIIYAVPGNQKGYARSLAPIPFSCVRRGGDMEDNLKKIAIVSLSDDAAFKLLERMSVFSSPGGNDLFGNDEDDVKDESSEISELRVDINVQSSYKTIVSKNVLAETYGGREDKIVIFGSHLDSVPAGPGVNDDGSGAMGTLELAHALHNSNVSGSTVQKIRFAWWTGEEIGLLGSTAYVKELSEHNTELLGKHKACIDTDMIASPNFVRGIWDGAALADPVVRRRSKTLHDVFATWFSGKDLPTVPFPFNGRSDFEPFLQAGVPTGGVITGEDEIKTEEGAAVFGGLAGIVLDPCYHQDCDRLSALYGAGETILKQNMDALGHMLETLSMVDDIEAFLDAGVPELSE